VLTRVNDAVVVALYNRAAALLFPSLAEGFGWPVLEALACGCAVVTTAAPPMTTVGGPWVHTIPVAPPPGRRDAAARRHWASQSAGVVQAVLDQTPAQREAERQGGLSWAARFDAAAWGQQLEQLYQQAQRLQRQKVQR
jgi:glycosyltransferase involved in cell wall biosynthesis